MGHEAQNREYHERLHKEMRTDAGVEPVYVKPLQRFELHRDVDETGISGIGIVAEGVQFSDGSAAMRWKSEFTSTAIYASMNDLIAIHGHNGATRVVWLDD